MEWGRTYELLYQIRKGLIEEGLVFFCFVYYRISIGNHFIVIPVDIHANAPCCAFILFYLLCGDRCHSQHGRLLTRSKPAQRDQDPEDTLRLIYGENGAMLLENTRKVKKRLRSSKCERWNCWRAEGGVAKKTGLPPLQNIPVRPWRKAKPYIALTPSTWTTAGLWFWTRWSR